MEVITLKFDEAFKELFANERVRRQFIADVLDIPVESIKSAKLVNPFLRKNFRKQKQSILDVILELNNEIKVNAELQIRFQKHWKNRQLFYLAKMYTEDLQKGEDYGRLKRCISIGILDFNLTEDAEYHSVYRLRDQKGRELTDLFEIHTIELRKQLDGHDRMDDWIRLFNAESREELDMIVARNGSMREAVETLKEMSLGKSLRFLYEEHLKSVRDRRAEDAYVYDTGVAQGKRLGRTEGKEEGRAEGRAEALLLVLAAKGEVPEKLKSLIIAEKNAERLESWLKTAAISENIEDFTKAI